MARRRPRPTEPPANAGARVGRTLDNVGRSAAEAPIVSSTQKAAISGGSIIVGLVAYAIGVAYVQHGWPGVTAWLKAKLMNKTSQQGDGVTPSMYFHTGAGGSAAGTQLAAAPPTHPAAPTPSGGTLYA